MDRTEPTYRELPFQARSGWAALIGLLLLEAALIATAIVAGTSGNEPIAIPAVVLAALTLPFSLPGFFLVNPNMSRVLVLFGRYRGTVRKEGFYWTNPFTSKAHVSLKAHNVASDTIKVNDLSGNPIEIGAVVVWQVRDTAQARFAVEDYPHYVDVQIEAAVRQLASTHPYDEGQADESIPTLRGDSAEVAEQLQEQLKQRLDRAGIEVVEARLSHLAYAPEIASAMLQRQQAAAIIAARQQIVEGAVGMVEHALQDLGRKNVVELDDERRATLVGNLLVVLCSHADPTPVLNTGSLYN